MIGNKVSFEKTTWQDISDEVKAVNPELFTIIEKLSPSKDYGLYRGCFPYGYETVRLGRLHLPNSQGEIVSIYDDSLASTVREDLSYNLGSNPVSLILKNCIEVYFKYKNSTIPFDIIPPGSLISIWVVLNKIRNNQPAFLWNVSSGARSIFTLPKISVAKKFNKLKRDFNLIIDPPLSLLDHGSLFKALANSSEFKNDWYTDILFFGKKWFEKLHDKAWIELRDFLYKKAWIGSTFKRDEFAWNLIFSLIQNRNNLRPNPYIADTAKHLLAMSIGAYPGFAPATNNDMAPISKLQEALINSYQLEKYMPIIMQPTSFDLKQASRPIYYSLEYPTTFNFSPKSRRTANKGYNLAETQYILGKYLSVLDKHELNLHGTSIDMISSNVSYDFFHNDDRLSHKVRNSSDIFKEDCAFKPICANFDQNKMLPVNSPFLKGCIRITKKS